MTTPLLPLYSFKEQVSFCPNIEFETLLNKKQTTVVVGMGGSATGVLLLTTMFPDLPLTLHNTYGLPDNIHLPDTLVILNSYSGETEEVLDVLTTTNSSPVSVAIITKGGTLLEEALVRNIPHVKLPTASLEPRFALIHQMIAILTLMGETEALQQLKEKIEDIDVAACEVRGKTLASLFTKKYIVIYTTPSLYSVAQGIKASITEGPKIPSFVSIVPEANHNELQSFVRDEKNDQHEMFGFLLLSSENEHPRIHKRFTVMENLYKEKSFPVFSITVNKTNQTQLLETLLSGYFLATYLAINDNVEPYKTPFIQLFKKKMSEK